MLKFEWDEVKRRLNFKSHSVDFEEAKPVFEDVSALEAMDQRFVYGQERWLVTGSAHGRILTVVHVERKGRQPHHIGEVGDKTGDGRICKTA